MGEFETRMFTSVCITSLDWAGLGKERKKKEDELMLAQGRWRPSLVIAKVAIDPQQIK